MFMFAIRLSEKNFMKIMEHINIKPLALAREIEKGQKSEDPRFIITNFINDKGEDMGWAIISESYLKSDGWRYNKRQIETQFTKISLKK